MSIKIQAGMSPQALLGCLDDKQVKIMKDNLKVEFYAKCEEERQKLQRGEVLFIAMTPDKVNRFLDILRQCGNGFQVQALQQIVLEKYELPDDFKEVETLGGQIMESTMRTV